MSDIKFNCPHCKGPLVVGEEGVGWEVACPHCGRSLLIPLPAKPGLGLAAPDHPARKRIDDAARFADRMVELFVVGEAMQMRINKAQALRLVTVIEKAVSRAPRDADLLVAKAAALSCAGQQPAAQEAIEGALKLDPSHFEAQQRKRHGLNWLHLFNFPVWTENSRTLPAAMEALFHRNETVQLVRDGLQVGVAILKRVDPKEFPNGLSPDMRSKWEPVWSETPFGPVVAHYLLVEDSPTTPFKGEGFLRTSIAEPVSPRADYWLLKRLCHLASCFLVLTDGSKVFYNARYLIPDATRAALWAIAGTITREPSPADITAFHRATQWHGQHFDLSRVRF
jgi:hypothetical protein